MASSGRVAGNLAYALVEFVGKFWSMLAHWMALEAPWRLEWKEEDDVNIMACF